jgi:hypothetical protein
MLHVLPVVPQQVGPGVGVMVLMGDGLLLLLLLDGGLHMSLLVGGFDKPGTKEHVELARGVFRTVEATFEMTNL